MVLCVATQAVAWDWGGGSALDPNTNLSPPEEDYQFKEKNVSNRLSLGPWQSVHRVVYVWGLLVFWNVVFSSIPVKFERKIRNSIGGFSWGVGLLEDRLLCCGD